MNSLAPERDLLHEARLIAALTDESRWVRLAAVRCLSFDRSERAAEALQALWPRVQDDPVERWPVLLAREINGIDALADVAQIIGLPENELRRHFPSEPTDDFKEGMARYDRYANFINGMPVQLEPVEVRFLGEYWRTHLRQIFHGRTAAPEEPAPDPVAQLKSTFEWELDNYARWGGPATQAAAAQLLEQVNVVSARRDRSALAGKIAEIALTSEHEYIRIGARKALARAGWEGGRHLLAALAGRPPFVPSDDAFARVRAEAERMYKLDRSSRGTESPAELAAFFAREAMEAVYDERTVAALLELALDGRHGADGRARAALVDMPLDQTLPVLGWQIVAGDDSPRTIARKRLLEAITHEGLRTEPAYNQIGDDMVVSDLPWLSPLLDRCRQLPAWAQSPEDAGSMAWARDRTTCIRMLRAAVRLVPLLEKRVDYQFFTPPAWARFHAHLTSLFGGKQEAKNEPAKRKYLRCLLAAQCAPGATIPLRVRVEELALGTKGLPPVDVTIPPRQEGVEVLVFARGVDCTVRPEFAKLTIPRTGNSTFVDFQVTPQGEGERTIEVTLFQGTDRVAYACLGLAVAVPDGTPAPDSDQHDVDPYPPDERRSRDQPRLVIHAEWQDGRITYRVTDPKLAEPAPRDFGVSPESFPRNTVSQWIEQQNEIIKDYLKEDFADEKEFQGAMAGLTSIGATLERQLVPTELIEYLRQIPPGALVAIESNESWVPWELLADDPAGEFWGQRFQLVRVPRLPAGSKLPELPPANPLADENPGARILAVIGDKVAVGAATGAFDSARTFGLPSSEMRDLKDCTFEDLRRAVGSSELIHFTCHGRNTPNFHLSLGEGVAKRFLAGQVRVLPLRPNSVVFANACASDRASLMLGTYESFGWEFYHRGARPFIGTLGPVPAAHAIRFAELFYHWFIQNGLSVGRAMQQARIDARKEFRNPFWLFYTIYGSATATWQPLAIASG